MPEPADLPPADDVDDTEPMPARDDGDEGQPPSWPWDETKGGEPT